MQETQGVTVIGYGTDEFPAFFTPRSGCKVNLKLKFLKLKKIVQIMYLKSCAYSDDNSELFLSPACV